MIHPIETGCRPDGGWVATMPRIPGLVVYEQSREEALSSARRLAAILRDEAMSGDGRILAFYPTKGPNSSL